MRKIPETSGIEIGKVSQFPPSEACPVTGVISEVRIWLRTNEPALWLVPLRLFDLASGDVAFQPHRGVGNIANSGRRQVATPST